MGNTFGADTQRCFKCSDKKEPGPLDYMVCIIPHNHFLNIT